MRSPRKWRRVSRGGAVRIIGIKIAGSIYDALAIPQAPGVRSPSTSVGAAHLFQQTISYAPILRQDLLHHVSFDIGQAEIPALVAVGEPSVIDAKLVQ